MKRKNMIVLLLAVLMLVSFYKLYTDISSVESQYNELISSAESYLELKLYEKSNEYYQQALEIEPSAEVYMAIARNYVSMDEPRNALNVGETALNAFPQEAIVYEFLAEAFISEEDYTEFFELCDQMHATGVESESVTRLEKELQYLYQIFTTAGEEAGIISQSRGAVGNAIGWGFVNASGKLVVACEYDEVKPFMNDLAPVRQDDEWFFINASGVKQENLSALIGDCEDVGNVSGGLFAVCVDGSCGYYSVEDYTYAFGEYEEAGAFLSGLAAVCESGNWYLINTSNEKVAGPYEEIVMDEKGIACRNERVIVSDGEEYYFIDLEGNRISAKGFKDVKPLGTDGYTAVKVGVGWGFVDVNGEEVIAAQYKDARSFSNGFAAVKSGDYWGYINTDGELVIEGNFTDARDMYSNGSAMVKTVDVWSVLKLYR